MATLHGILAELGIENPIMHPEREELHEDDWVAGDQFTPEVGKSYLVAFARFSFDGEEHPYVKRVRIDRVTTDGWHDLDDDAPLEPEFRNLPIRGFRPLG